MISATTSNAAGTSTSLPTTASTVTASERRRGDTAPSVSACVVSALIIIPRLDANGSGQLADGFLQYPPGLVAVFSLPFGEETGRAQFIAEWRQIRLVEGQTLGREFLADGRIKLFRVDPGLQRRLVDVLLHNCTHIRRQRFQSAPIGQEPITVPHVVGQRAVFLDLIELGGR